ncbi:MAG TPA: MG2 domain-containing protein, partial [Myxococcota bacterium]|nr:MG2 domain-containing protein [Myxococcota bacterium]
MKRIEKFTIAAVLLVACSLSVTAATSRPAKVRRVLSHVVSDEQFVPGTRASIRIVTHGLTGLLSSRPLAGARVMVSLQAGKRKRTLFSGKSDSDGVTRARFDVPDWPEGSYQMVVDTRAQAGSNRVTHAVALKRNGRILLVTDKPIYQPGQLVHMRLLALNAYDLKPLAREKVLFEVQDPKGNKVFKKRLKTSAYGVSACDFQLASEINMGNYQVTASCENQQLAEATQKTLVVKKYVLPKFKVQTETDQAFYLPRQTIKGKIQSDYFFGKPVAGAQVEVKASTFDVEFKEFAALKGQTDENGHWEFELKLPDYFVGQPVQKGDAVVKLEVKVTDSAKHTEKGVKTVPVAEAPIRLDAVPEGGRIVAGVQNMIYLVASYPDGSPAEAEVVMLRDGKQLGKVKTDSTGLGALPVTPRADELGFDAGQPHGSFGRDRRRFGRRRPQPVARPNRSLVLSFSAQDSKGARCQVTKSFSTRSAKDRVLLRTDKAIYKSGDAIQVTVLTSDVGGTCFLDLIKNRQTILTRSLPVAKGKGSVRLPLGSDIFGSLELSAYKILGNGEIMRDTRVLYVQPRRQLRIDVTQNKKVYRPGEEALIKFRVQDTQGRAVTAGMGVIIVDEAVYALQEIRPGLEKVYFTLERELTNPKYQIEFGPSASLATLVKTERLQMQKQRVAKVLLAKAQPLGKPAAWPNPLSGWLTSSRSKAQRDLGAIQQALYSFIRSQPVGRLTPGGGWVYKRNLVKRMIETKALPAGNSRGPFGDPYTPEEIESLWPHLAAAVLLPPQELERLRSLRIAIYRRLLEQSQDFADLESGTLAKSVEKAFDEVMVGGHSPATNVTGRKFRWADVEKLPAFRAADFAAEINQFRARRVYRALSSYSEQARPWSTWMQGRLDKKANAFELPDNVLERLIVLVLAREKDTRDVWGHAFVLKKMKAPRARAFFDYRLRFYELVSAGPDGKVGTSDDISFEYPAGDVGCETLAQAFGGQAYCNLRETPALKGLPPPPPMKKGARRFEKMARMEERTMARPTAAGAPMPEATMEMDKEMREVEAPGGSAGSGPAAPKKRAVRVRNFFPETLLFAPLLKTTNTGNVSLKVPLADSITTWRMTVSANAAAGGLGSTSHAVRVFQDFFVDLDLPVALTQNDELSIPVVVYNYLKTPQRVRLELESGDWFTLSGSPIQEIALEPNEVSSTYYRIKVLGLGDKTLQVRADGSNMSDAIRRQIEVLPDGKEMNVVANGRLEGALEKTIDIP